MTDCFAIRIEYAFGDCPGAGTVPVWFGADVEADVLRRVDIFGDDGGLLVFGGDVGGHIVKGGRVVELSWERFADDNAEHRERGEEGGKLHDDGDDHGRSELLSVT